MVKVTGRQNAKRKFQALRGAGMVEEVTKALYAGANHIASDAAHSITEGSTSGAGHVPSLPGEPPNADTHALDRQIESEIVGPLHARASSNAPHARHMEKGTSTVAPRPYMGPAAQRGRPVVQRLVRDAVNRVTKRA